MRGLIDEVITISVLLHGRAERMNVTYGFVSPLCAFEDEYWKM